jgi:hypothetical protein
MSETMAVLSGSTNLLLTLLMYCSLYLQDLGQYYQYLYFVEKGEILSSLIWPNPGSP